MPQRSKPRPKKKESVVLPDSDSKVLRNSNSNEPPPLRNKSKAKAAAGRKRPAPSESESEDEVTTTIKTPKRAVRQKVATRKQTVTEKNESALETQKQVDEDPRVPAKKKIVRRKPQPPPNETSSPAKKPFSSLDLVDEDEKTERVPVEKRGGTSRTKKVVLEVLTERVEGNNETGASKRQSSVQKKAGSKSTAIQVDASEDDQKDDIPQANISKKVVRRNKAKVPSNERALQPVEYLNEEEENDGRESPVAKKKVMKKVVKKKAAGKVIEQPATGVDGADENMPEEPMKEEEEAEMKSPVAKKKATKKVVKKKAAVKVIEQPATGVDDANENIPEQPKEEEEDAELKAPVAKKKVIKKAVKKKTAGKVIEQPATGVDDANENVPVDSETKPPVKKKRVRTKSLVSVELPLTPSRKRTVPVISDPADRDTPEQKIAKVSKTVAKRTAVQHSPVSTNRNADITFQAGNESNDEEKEYTSIAVAVPKPLVKRRTHAQDEPLPRRTLPSKSKPASIEDTVVEQHENNDDAVPTSIKLVKTRNRLPAADDGISSRQPMLVKSNKRAEQNHPRDCQQQISIPPTTETKERQSDHERPVPVMLRSPVMRSPGPSGTCIASPSHSYGKPFVFSGIPTGDHHDTVIPLPVCDTPMIQKNREFREAGGVNRRRSSFVMRGKRASSMSGGSLIALPHPSVPSESFFRHIAAEAPEPVRMKQLLAWCARRVEIPAGRSVDHQSLQIAQQVRERIITAILEGKISTSWYNRKEGDVLPEITGPKELKEHPQNVDNRRLLKEHEDTIERLEQEEAAWTATLREYNSRHAAVVDSCPFLSDEPILIDVEGEGEERRVMKEVMNTALAAVEEQVGNDSIDVDDEWLDSTMAEVEIKVDRLHSTLHTASQFNRVAREYTEDLFAKLLESLSLRRGDRLENANDAPRNVVDPIELLRTFAATTTTNTVKAPPPTTMTTTTDGTETVFSP